MLLLGCKELDDKSDKVELTQTDSIEDGLNAAVNSNKRVLIYYNGFGCVNCRYAEERLRTKEANDYIFKNFILVDLKTDDRKEISKEDRVFSNLINDTIINQGQLNRVEQFKRFGTTYDHAYIILNEKGQLIATFTSEQGADNFFTFLHPKKK